MSEDIAYEEYIQNLRGQLFMSAIRGIMDSEVLSNDEKLFLICLMTHSDVIENYNREYQLRANDFMSKGVTETLKRLSHNNNMLISLIKKGFLAAFEDYRGGVYFIRTNYENFKEEEMQLEQKAPAKGDRE
jgi:hypothetical protein